MRLVKCYQCGQDVEQSNIPEEKTLFEVSFKCGYVRRIIWQQMDTDNIIGRMMDILDDEKSSDEQKVLSLQELV